MTDNKKPTRESVATMAQDMGLDIDEFLGFCETEQTQRDLKRMADAQAQREQDESDARTLRWLRVHASEMSVTESDGELCMNFKSPEDFDRQVAEAMARGQS